MRSISFSILIFSFLCLGRGSELPSEVVERRDVDRSSVSNESANGSLRRRALAHLPQPDGHRRRLEFVHITKTGGSAIEKAAASAGLLWGACHYVSSPRLGCTDPDIARFDRNEFLPLTRYQTKEPYHVPLQYHVTNPFRHAATFTVVRNPYDRYVSEYYCEWAGYRGPDRDNPEKMNVFIQHQLRTRVPEDKTVHFLPQNQYVYHEGKRYVDHILHYETLSEEFPKLMEYYNLNNIVLPNRDNANNSYRKLTVKDLYRSTIDLINMKAREDFVLFGYEMI